MNQFKSGDAMDGSSTAVGSPPGDLEASYEFLEPGRPWGDFFPSDTDEDEIQSNPIPVHADTENNEEEASTRKALRDTYKLIMEKYRNLGMEEKKPLSRDEFTASITPASQTSASETQTSASETQTPAWETQTLAWETTPSAWETPTFAPPTPTFSSEIQTSASEIQTSASETQTSASEIQTSASEIQTLASETQTSASGTQASASETTPSAWETTPSAWETTPSAWETTPSAWETTPSAWETTPSETPDTDSKCLEIKFLTAQNQAMKAKIELLENVHAEEPLPVGSPQSAILHRIAKGYMKSANELSNCLVSTQSRYAEEQNILRECAETINAESRKFADEKSLTHKDRAEFEMTLNNYRKRLISVQIQILDDKRKTFTAEKQYQRLLTGFRQLADDFESVKLESQKLTLIEEEKQENYAEIKKSLDEREKKLSEEKASLSNQQQKLNEDKAHVHAELQCLMQRIESLHQEKEKLASEKVDLQNMKDIAVRQRQLHFFEIAKQNEEIAQLKKQCGAFAKKINRLQAERVGAIAEKDNLLGEREFLDESNKLLADEATSREKECDELKQKNNRLRRRCDLMQVDLDRFKAELAEAQDTIVRLSVQNDQLQEAASQVEIYKIQMEERERDSLQMFEAEINYLQQIEKFTNENRELREENRRLRN